MTLDERTQRHQRTRIRRLGMAVASYALAAMVIMLGAALDVLAWRHVGYFVGMSVLINAGLYLFFRSGLNLRLANANATAQQIALSVIPYLYVMYHVQTALGRVAILMTSFVGLLYGILDLSMRQFLTVTAFFFASYIGLVVFLASGQSRLLEQPGEWMILVSMAVVMLQMGLIGGYISQLRTRLSEKNKQIAEMAARDELTGAYNRHHLMKVLASECARAQRGSQFSIGLMDLDHFKQVNDTYGHLMGDEVLRRFAEYIAGGVREIDSFGRYGGEEFLLIMPLTSAEAMCEVAERLSAAVRKLEFAGPAGSAFGITVTMGVAESGGMHEKPDDMLRRADRALYRAKAAGRDRVYAATVFDAHDNASASRIDAAAPVPAATLSKV